MNYSVDAYYKETMRVGPSKTEKAPRVPRAPKQINLQEFQFFPEWLQALQEQKYNVYRGTNVTPEELEAERDAEQKRIDEAEPLTEEEVAEKDEPISQGFENWSRRDFQQFVRALETHGWMEDFEVLASEIGDKTARYVIEYNHIFQEKWESLSEFERIVQQISEGKEKRNKQNALENMLVKKVQGVLYPMEELELNYRTSKGRSTARRRTSVCYVDSSGRIESG
ncbi:ISWI, HAND domain-containing protein [Phellopilus nigrolimitatus]|nr:ISWI, HAND domain-containing protein [Phellopilus nigrolimitatus]